MSVPRCLRPLFLLSRLCGRYATPAPPSKCALRLQTCSYISSDSHSTLLFEQKVDNALESLCDQMEEVLCRSQNVKDYDVSLSSGVLTVSLGELGTYVINKQSANQQIWLSSPVSGPKRYDLHHGVWTYQRSGQSLDQLLNNELTTLLQVPASIKLD